MSEFSYIHSYSCTTDHLCRGFCRLCNNCCSLIKSPSRVAAGGIKSIPEFTVNFFCYHSPLHLRVQVDVVEAAPLQDARVQLYFHNPLANSREAR